MRKADNRASARKARKVPLPWEKAIENFDRVMRRGNLAWKTNTIRLDLVLVALIATDRAVPLSKLNELGPSQFTIG